MARIAIQDLFQPVELDLWGREYRSVPVTRPVKAALAKVQEAGEQLEKEFEALPQPLSDEQEAEFGRRLVGIKASLLAARFTPAGQGRKPVDEVLMEKWDSGDVGEDEIDMLLEAVGEAQARPT